MQHFQRISKWCADSAATNLKTLTFLKICFALQNRSITGLNCICRCTSERRARYFKEARLTKSSIQTKLKKKKKSGLRINQRQQTGLLKRYLFPFLFFFPPSQQNSEDQKNSLRLPFSCNYKLEMKETPSSKASVCRHAQLFFFFFVC